MHVMTVCRSVLMNVCGAVRAVQINLFVVLLLNMAARM
jgi:hypothetical protein